MTVGRREYKGVGGAQTRRVSERQLSDTIIATEAWAQAAEHSSPL